jgi:hypothetical protein
MAQERPLHPITAWREEKGLSLEDVSKLVASKGGQITPRSLEAIEKAWRHPSYKLAEVLSGISHIPIAVLKKWPLRNKRSAA